MVDSNILKRTLYLDCVTAKNYSPFSNQSLHSIIYSTAKPKFHYADFATKIADFVATIWTCRDALKARNFFMTSPFRGPRPRLSLVKIGVMESGLNCGKVQQQLFKPLLASVTSRSRLGMQALTAREWRCRTLRQLMLLQQLLVYPASETLL